MAEACRIIAVAGSPQAVSGQLIRPPMHSQRCTQPEITSDENRYNLWERLAKLTSRGARVDLKSPTGRLAQRLTLSSEINRGSKAPSPW
jgi:hypothetical protein